MIEHRRPGAAIQGSLPHILVEGPETAAPKRWRVELVHTNCKRNEMWPIGVGSDVRKTSFL